MGVGVRVETGSVAVGAANVAVLDGAGSGARVGVDVGVPVGSWVAIRVAVTS
jgi:hypothetical protein